MKIGKAVLEVACCDITTIDAAGVVNPANTMLWMGGGVSSRLRKRGGKQVEDEALRHAPAELGSAVVTSAGGLAGRWMFHAVIAGQDLTPTETSIREALASVFREAARVGCTSIALPLLTTEHQALPPRTAARLMVDGMVRYLVEENKTITRVVLVEQDESSRNLFKDALDERFSRHG